MHVSSSICVCSAMITMSCIHMYIYESVSTLQDAQRGR